MSIRLEIDKSFEGDPMKLCRHLFDGNSIVFDFFSFPKTVIRFNLFPSGIQRKIASQERFHSKITSGFRLIPNILWIFIFLSV